MAFLAGLGRVSRFAAVRALATAYIEFFRGTSIFVQLFWAYFVLPFFGVPLTPLQAGVLALGLNVGAYGAEVVRGAVRSIGKEQYEACVALNLGRWQSMRHVILPQALLLMLPTFGNNAIELLKATSVVSLISLADMTFQAQVVRAADRQHAGALRHHPHPLFPDGFRHRLRRARPGAPHGARPRRHEDRLMEWDWDFVWQIMPTLIARREDHHPGHHPRFCRWLPCWVWRSP